MAYQQQHQSPPPQQQQQQFHQPDQFHQPQQHQLQAAPQYQQQQPMQSQFSHGPAVQDQEWSNGICSCGPCELCCMGTWLPCLLLGKTSERMRDPTLQTYDAFNTDCLLMCGISFFTGCGWIYGMMKRTEIRERFGIKGSGTSDCCTSYWCPCCALIQQEKEVIKRTAHVQGPVVQAYQPQKEGMQMHHPTQ